jgi:DNA-directed RNA polymerase specialized sigma24 family protein
MSFPPTAWSLLAAVGDARQVDDQQRVELLNRLITIYWRPCWAFLRRRGYSEVEAEDLTQEFWLQCLEKPWLAQADRSRGKFRSYLLTLLSHFAADQSPQRCRKQAAFEQGLVPVSVLVRSSDYSLEIPQQATPETLFMREWARSLVDAVRERLRQWCFERGRPDWYAIFAAVHFRSANEGPVTQEGLSQQFSCSRDQIRYALSQAEEHFSLELRAAVADQVATPEQIDSELQELLALIQP